MLIFIVIIITRLIIFFIFILIDLIISDIEFTLFTASQQMIKLETDLLRSVRFL